MFGELYSGPKEALKTNFPNLNSLLFETKGILAEIFFNLPNRYNKVMPRVEVMWSV
jgi:hypothetical protein